VLLTGYATPERIRNTGQAHLTGWLKRRHVRDAAGLAARAVTAPGAQQVVLPGQDVAAGIVAKLPSQRTSSSTPSNHSGVAITV